MNIDIGTARVLRSAALAVTAASTLATATLNAHAQDFYVLYAFPQNGGLGSDISQMSMIQATDGNFYGTTFAGGDYANYSGGAGTIFKVSPSGQLTQLWAFSCAQGSVCSGGRSPEGGVVQASDGNFYGTTYGGGANDQGTIYRLTPQGELTTLHSFCDSPNACSPDDGADPVGALIQASNGDLYGTTVAGTAFRVSLKGKFTLLYTWPPGGGSDGALTQLANGDLYGTTSGGGAHAVGTVFKMTLGGKVTTLYSFGSQPNCADGQTPLAGLVRGADGAFYGTTEGGGTSGCGGFGTVFRITPMGAFTSLVSFQGDSTIANPTAPLILATDGTLYGTSLYGGNPDDGTVFQIVNGALGNVFPLTGCVGGHPYGGLLQSTNGNFYGSDQGGCGDDGTIFELSTGLGPFVTAIPNYGKHLAKIIVQGTNLTGATKVSFHGTNAAFTPVSASEIVATVPDGATSGEIKVVTPNGTLNSSASFKILK